MITRRQCLTAAGAIPAIVRAQARKPNILVLFSDDQRFDTIAALGNTEVRTPNLDRLARSGTTFTQAHIMGGAAPAVCVASRAMFLSGQTLFRADERLTAEVTGKGKKGPFHLFPEHFRKQGYTTFGTGKWHNRAPLYARCFSSGDNIFFGGMSDHFNVPLSDFRSHGDYPAKPDRTGSKHSSELFSDAAVSFLEQHKSADPFLMYVAYTAPHDPRTCPDEYRRMYKPESLRLPASFVPQHPFDNGELKIRDEMLAPFPRTPEVVRQHIADYYAAITHMDSQIGRVLDALERSGRANDTIIVFASDNGLAVGRHGLMGKQNLYDHSVRVPLIFSGPGIAKNRRTDSLCYLLDVFPTLCNLAGVSSPGTVEGVNLREGRTRDSLFFAYRHLQRGVSTAEWKMIRYYVGSSPRTQLFDRRRDPDELHDLSEQRKYAATIRELEAKLRQWMETTGDPLLERS